MSPQPPNPQPAANSRLTGATILFCALAALVLYAVLPHFITGLSLAEPSFASQVFGWVRHLSKQKLVSLQDADTHNVASFWFAGICAAEFIIYFVMLRLARRELSQRWQSFLFLAGAAFLLVQVFAPIMLSTDVYAYALYGRVVTVYHANPYDLAPPVAHDDQFLRFFGQDYLPSWYGPVWTLASAGLAKFGGGEVGLTVLLFRLTAVLAALVCAALIRACLRLTAPDRATQGMVFFLWNPLLVIETGLSGHNDSVMLLFVLLAVWLHLRGWKTGAVIALTLSALVKFLTGMLVPLYLLLVLREVKTWRERILFLARSGVAIAALAVAGSLLTHSNASGPVEQQAVATDFYANNFHELILKKLRLSLGEDADSVKAPIYFQGWWLAAETNDFLRVAPDSNAPVLRPLAPGTRVIVIAPQESDWARVYDPAGHDRGWVDTTAFDDSTRPANADPLAKLFDTMTADRPIVQHANNLLRAALWAAFALFGLWCAWRTTNLEEFVVWSAAALLASYYLILTEIWPWYVNWAVALGALAPWRRPAKLALLLSICVMTLNITLGFEGSEADWVYQLRSLPAFVLPLALFVVLYCRRRRASQP
jgi:hypothetical protein